ncbi:MAG: tetratricopeptide repeat protein [Pseudomonadota bacterium]
MREPGTVAGRSGLHHDFVDGLKCFRGDDYEGALVFFRAADASAAIDDTYQNRYTSFHGLCRVCLGDRNGIKLCRKAALGETRDPEVFYNLALAEYRLGQRESARAALRRGLVLEPGHRGLLHLRRELELGENRSLIPGLRRDNVLNRLLNRILQRVRGARAE